MSKTRAKDERSPVEDRMLRVLLPIAVLALGVVLWELVVRVGDIPPYVLPGPHLVFSTLISDWAVLGASLFVTLTTTLEGFLLAAPAAAGPPCCSTSHASSDIRFIPTRASFR